MFFLINRDLRHYQDDVIIQNSTETLIFKKANI